MIYLNNFQESIGYLSQHPQYETSVANQAIIHHGHRTYALCDTDRPLHLKVEQKKDKVNITTIDYEHFEETLKHNVTSHVKVDKR